MIENNRRIAKNTLYLYIRMFFMMGVSLFTSRIVLSTLGIEDYGIYNVVGGVVALFSFLNNTLSTATSRFITFELGTGNFEKLKKIFENAVTIHFSMAFIVLVLAETIGLWFFENKLVIPDNRMNAARIVYQLSIIATMISIIRVPYNAAIIAHERMNIYAYFSIIEVSLKLLIAYLLMLSNFDKLVTYSMLATLIAISISFMYGYYSIKQFAECGLKFHYEKDIAIPMLSFSGWDLYGNMSVMARTQGINILQNMFFGPMINAAGGVASQVQYAVAGFANNFLVAVRPQIVKNYAQGNIVEMQKLVNNSSKFSFLLLFLMSFPLILENKFVLNLWLEEVPDYAIVFCQLVLVLNLISIVFRPLVYSIHSTGHIKRLSFITGTILFMVLPLSYYFLKIGFSPVIPYIINIILLILCCLNDCFIVRSLIPLFSVYQFMTKSILIVFIIASISIPIPFMVHINFEIGWMRFILVGISFVISLSITTFFIALNKENRISLLRKIIELKEQRRLSV